MVGAAVDRYGLVCLIAYFFVLCMFDQGCHIDYSVGLGPALEGGAFCACPSIVEHTLPGGWTIDTPSIGPGLDMLGEVCEV